MSEIESGVVGGVHGKLIGQRRTRVGNNPSQFVSKDKISKSSSLLKVRGRSYFILILIFSFSKTQPIVNSLYDIGWINFFKVYKYGISEATTSLA